MIEVQYNDGRCQILRDGVELCDISIDDALTVKETLIRDGDPATPAPPVAATEEEAREWFNNDWNEIFEGTYDPQQIYRLLVAFANRPLAPAKEGGK